jgi:hypothetical protein
MMYSQNNKIWKHEPLNKSDNTIGEVGCLLTSLVNIYKIKHPDSIMTPLYLNALFVEKNGYTKDNYIIWSVVETILDVEIQHIYTGEIEYNINSFYIVNFLNFGSGHFTNLLSYENSEYNIFDVWDGTYKTISTPRRLVKVVFR